MSNKSSNIASILLLIILIIIIGIGIGIASVNKLAIAELHLNAMDLKPASELRGLAVRGGAVLLSSNLQELAAAKHQVLQLDVHNLL